MSTPTKVIGCLVVILCLFAGTATYLFNKSSAVAQKLVVISEAYLPLSRAIVGIRSDLILSRKLKEFYPQAVAKKFEAAEGIVSRWGLAEVSSLMGTVRAGFVLLMSAKDKATFDSVYFGLLGDLGKLSKQVDEECQKITLMVQNEGRDNLVSTVLLSAAVVLLGAIAVFFSYRVLMPLPNLIQSIRKIADGDLHQSLKVRTSDKDEIALLAREYNRMLETLRERDLQIQRQQIELLHRERLAAIGQLSAEIVHEIRNPLNSISLNIDWLANEVSGTNEEVTRVLTSLAREVERLNQITESYLVRAKVPIDEESKTEVNDLIQEVLSFSMEEDRTRNIRVTHQLSEDSLFVRTDRSRLKQAFLNVIKNAREAMPNGGKLHVETIRNGNVFEVRFSDTGYGMNEPTKQKAFHPFYTTKANGTGLGLMLTKEIAEEAHGSLLCESALGRGTTFTFQFPA